jgi:hypothetical protein
MGAALSGGDRPPHPGGWQDGVGLGGEAVVYRGLRNELGQQHCFLNAVLQGLWHLAPFRHALMDAPPHQHAAAGEGCITCSLRSLYTFYQFAEDTALPPDPVRRALADAYAAAGGGRFRLGEQEDAGETLDAVCAALHREALLQQDAPRVAAADAAGADLGDVPCSPPCAAHAVFSIASFSWLRCRWCGATSNPAPEAAMSYGALSEQLRALARTVAASGSTLQPPLRGGQHHHLHHHPHHYTQAGPSPASSPTAAALASVRGVDMRRGVGAVAPDAALRAASSSPSSLSPGLGPLLSALAAAELVGVAGAGTDDAAATAAAVYRMVHDGVAPDVVAACRTRAGGAGTVIAAQRHCLALPPVWTLALHWPADGVSKEAVADVLHTLLGGSGSSAAGSGLLLDLRTLYHVEPDGQMEAAYAAVSRPPPAGLLQGPGGGGGAGSGSEATHSSSSSSASSSAASAHPSADGDHGGGSGHLYMLRGLICYYGRHYIAILKSERRRAWLLLDDSRVSVLGPDISDVVAKCVSARYQPTLVFYEQMSSGRRTTPRAAAAGAAAAAPPPVTAVPVATGSASELAPQPPPTSA